MISRRDLLKSGGAIVVSFALSRRLPAQNGAGPAQGPNGLEAPRSVDPHDVDSFLALHADGSVTIYTGRVDVGTGFRIAIAQMTAEELGVPVDRITVVEGDTALTPDQGVTGGSTGLTRGAADVRQAAATLREAMLKLPPGQLAAGRQFFLKVDPKAPLKKAADYTIVGQSLRRPDLPAKCTGKHVYVQDLVLPGMLHGRVVRPAAIGAKLVSVDESSIHGIPDVRVVRQESFLAVVAKDEWAAVRAARELKASWSEWQGLPDNSAPEKTGGLEQYLRSSAIARDEVIINRGDASASMPAAASHFSATYHWPFQSHASLGPSCSVADVRDGGATIWSATQNAHNMRQNLAKVFGMPAEKVRVIFLDGAGSYGTNGNDDAAADAVLLSKIVGAPVRVQWMRQDEHGWDPKGPPQLLDVRAGTDAEGRITAWETEMWLPANKPGARALLAADAAGLKQDRGQGAGATALNGDPPYPAPNVRVTVHWLEDSTLRISNLRAPGKIGNVFAVESFTDELAAGAKVDAVAFRMRGLKDPRATAAIERASQMLDWQARPSPNPQASGKVRTGRGIAYMRYKQAENYVAVAMEIEVEPASGRVTVRKVACAHDCGLIVNPDALRNQVEGCIMQTLSRTLHEEVKFDRSRITTVDWASYPILRFTEVPEIEVSLLNHPEVPILGAGEAATAPVAAALGNAIFDATGVRLRTVPFTASRVRAALA